MGLFVVWIYGPFENRRRSAGLALVVVVVAVVVAGVAFANRNTTGSEMMTGGASGVDKSLYGGAVF